MRSVVIFSACAIAAGFLVPKYAVQVHGRTSMPAVMAARPVSPTAPKSSDSREVVIPPSANGHFQVEGSIDGRRMNFMVDTGASVIALTAGDAAKLGIHPAQSEYRAMVRTANGVVRAAPVMLDRVEIEDISVRDVAALVLPEGALGDNLLGLTFLSKLRRFEYSEGKLVLEQ